MNMKIEEDDLVRMNRVLRHRLRNFASGLKSSINFLSKELASRMKPQEMEYIPLILNECDGITDITNRMQMLFDPVFQSEQAPAAEALEKALQGIRDKFPTARYHLVNMELLDPLSVAQVQCLVVPLQEVLRNAVEAAFGREIVLRCARTGNMFQLSVENEGKPVDAAELPRFVRPFYTTKPRHLGLGLTIALKWSSTIGGEIHVQSRDQGGLCCRMDFPLNDATIGFRMIENRIQTTTE